MGKNGRVFFCFPFPFSFRFSFYLYCISKISPPLCFITMVTRFKISDRKLSAGPEGRLIAVNPEDRDWAQFENNTGICWSNCQPVEFLIKRVCVKVCSTGRVLGPATSYRALDSTCIQLLFDFSNKVAVNASKSSRASQEKQLSVTRNKLQWSRIPNSLFWLSMNWSFASGINMQILLAQIASPFIIRP